MDFDEWKDEAANHLEDSGAPYSVALDDALFALWKAGEKPHEVINKLPNSPADPES